MVNPASYCSAAVVWLRDLNHTVDKSCGESYCSVAVVLVQAINCKDRALLSVQVELKYISPVYTLSSLIKIVQSVQGVVDAHPFLKSPGYRLYFPGSRPHLAQKHCPWNLFYYCGFIGVIITSKFYSILI